ncbi:dihydrodipicolinate synthase family protein [Mycolicibacterium sphagni]|uniref:dihydrodipicolinate synthase family protein n=1 Tax=Mycolicibacterium sphagni TaxID=1786 RepID=UPI0021F25110|nr:dihydrodipicolinate synthase family protein [Mycolicibacterium sphagni]
MQITRSDIRGVIGIVPTPATADADDWRATDTVDTAETARMVDKVVQAGIEFVMTAGTFGECASLTHAEWHTLTACVAETIGGRVPYFAGVTTLNTRDTIARARQAVAAGADGLFIGRPMWLPLDDVAIVRFYRDITEALPATPIVVYDNPAAFKGKISVEAYQALADLPEIVATKHASGAALDRDMRSVGDRIAVLPLDSDWCRAAQLQPDRATACWSGNVACAPSPLAALSRAVLARDWPRAEEISKRIDWVLAPQFGEDMARFMDYSIAIGRGRFRGAGLIQCGPARPPYTDAPAELIAGGVETGTRWAALEQEFSTGR